MTFYCTVCPATLVIVYSTGTLWNCLSARSQNWKVLTISSWVTSTIAPLRFVNRSNLLHSRSLAHIGLGEYSDCIATQSSYSILSRTWLRDLNGICLRIGTASKPFSWESYKNTRTITDVTYRVWVSCLQNIRFEKPILLYMPLKCDESEVTGSFTHIQGVSDNSSDSELLYNDLLRITALKQLTAVIVIFKLYRPPKVDLCWNILQKGHGEFFPKCIRNRLAIGFEIGSS